MQLVAVLCDDFDIGVVSEEIDFENPEKIAEMLIPKLERKELCLVYSANFSRDSVF